MGIGRARLQRPPPASRSSSVTQLLAPPAKRSQSRSDGSGVEVLAYILMMFAILEIFLVLVVVDCPRAITPLILLH